MSRKFPEVYLPIRIKNAVFQQETIFPEVKNLDLKAIQDLVSKPVIVFDIDQKILIQISPNDIIKVGLDTDAEVIDSLLHGLNLSLSGSIQNGDALITALGKLQSQLNSLSLNLTNLFSTKTTSNLAEGSNRYFTDSRARLASIQNSINPSETQRGASQRAVHLAIEELKTNLESLIESEEQSRESGIQSLNDQISSLITQLNTLFQELEDESQIRVQEDSGIRNEFQSDLVNLIQYIEGVENALANIPKNFLELPDTPNSFNLQQGKLLAVDSSGSEIVFIDPPDRNLEIQFNNSQFILSAQNIWTIIPLLGIPIQTQGLYEIEFTSYSRTSSSNRTHSHRLRFNGVPIPESEISYLLRDSNRSCFKYLSLKQQFNEPGFLQIEARRTGGNGNYESWEKILKVRKISE